jgi:DNA-binding MarR family transcriptional regulator
MEKGHPLPFDPIEEAIRQWRVHGWAEAANGMGVVTSIIRAQQIVAARAESVVKPFQLTFARYEVLMLLIFSQRGELPVGKIGERLQVHPASVTNAVGRLEEARLVRRRINPQDGRGILAAITSRGRTVVHRATLALNESLFRELELSNSEAAALFSLLAKLRYRAGDFQP